ncbi:hypothetical protein EAF04_001760 [Stromatinia cepivora]|nr:hypothetical protein EAF04_001760 [Stromatinia cepivora]
MKYSFTAITFAFLAMAIHASPVQFQDRDITTMEDSNATNTTMPDMPAPAAPPADARAPPTDAPAPPTNAPAPPKPPTGASITDAPGLTNSTSTTSTTSTTGTVFPGTAVNCTMFYTVLMGDTCQAVGEKTGITFDVLKSLNKGIDAACSNLIVGQALCVKA